LPTRRQFDTDEFLRWLTLTTNQPAGFHTASAESSPSVHSGVAGRLGIILR
jgi:hypothetical protein